MAEKLFINKIDMLNKGLLTCIENTSTGSTERDHPRVDIIYFISLLLIPFREKGCTILFHAITFSTYMPFVKKNHSKF